MGDMMNSYYNANNRKTGGTSVFFLAKFVIFFLYLPLFKKCFVPIIIINVLL